MKKYINVSITGIEISNEKVQESCKEVFEDLLTSYCSKHFGTVFGDVTVEDCKELITFEEGLERILDEGYDVDYNDEDDNSKCFTCPYCDEYIYKTDYPVFFLVKGKSNKEFRCPICNEEI